MIRRIANARGGRLPWAVWVIGASAVIWMAVTRAPGLPAWDEIDFIPAYAGTQSAGPGWLWEQHYEYRMPLPKLVYLALCRMTGCDFRAPAIAAASGLSLFAALMLVAARRARGRWVAQDVILPALLLHPGHVQVITENDYLTYVISLLALAPVVPWIASGAGRQTAVAAAIGIAILPLCGAFGAAWLMPLALFAISRVRKAGRAPMLGSVVGLIFLVLYTAGYHRPAGEPDPPDVRGLLGGALRFAVTALGPAGEALWPVSGMIAIGLLIPLVSRLLAAWRRGDRRAAGWLAVLGSVGLAALAVGYGRSGHDTGAPFANRYGPVSAAGWCAGWLALATLDRGQTLPRIRWLPVALALAVLPFDIRAGLRTSAGRRDTYRMIGTEIRLGLPPRETARRWWPVMYYSEGLLGRRLTELRDAGLGPYRPASGKSK